MSCASSYTRLFCIGLLGVILISCDSVVQFHGDDTSDEPEPHQLSTRTVLKSSSLAGGSVAYAKTGSDATLTPDNITGEVLSLLFATAGQIDEGIVFFGDGRPDIAPATTTLYPFDMADHLAVNATTMLKPGFVGGVSEHGVALFGYIDVEVTLGNGAEHIVRVALAEVNGMQRGDKLLDDGTGTFQWYDLDTAQFTNTRPTNPAVLEDIRDFTDPVRPNLVFYPLNVFLNTPVSLNAVDLAASTSLDVEVDFFMGQAIVLEGETTTSVDTATLITSFNLVQVTEGFGTSGLDADATMVLIP